MWLLIGRVLYWLAWPALYVYFRIGARTRGVVVVDDHILLVQGWLGDGRWGLPGGGLHRNEQPAAGLVRETTEETSVRLRQSQLHDLGSEWQSVNGLRFRAHFFGVSLNTQVLLRPRGEIVAARWVPLKDLPLLPHKTDVDRGLQLLHGGR